MSDSVFPAVLINILGIIVIFFIYNLGNEYLSEENQGDEAAFLS